MPKRLSRLVICMVLGLVLPAVSSAQQPPPGKESPQTMAPAPSTETDKGEPVPCPMHQSGAKPGSPAGTPTAGHDDAAHHHGTPPDVTGSKGPSDHLRDHHEKMMAEMKASDARLAERVAAMNAATGNDKVEAMAAVINELVAQRNAMREHMMERRGAMGHPPAGQAPGPQGQGGPPDCPMMKGPHQHPGAPADKTGAN